MRTLIRSLLAGWFLCSAATADEPKTDPNLPTVVLIGDSIRLGYTSTVVKELAGRANVVGPSANGGDSSNVLSHIGEWAIQRQPDVVHFNCGIHDVKKSKKTGTFQTPPDKYEANLRKIVERLRKETKAKIIFALTTPLVDDRAAKVRVDRDYELLDASTEQYNEIARRVMKELDVPVNDLRAALGDRDEQLKLIVDDGVHFKPEGSKKLGQAVAAFVGPYFSATKPAAK
jgi:lysophospholipase L1-like esterase